MKELLRAFKIDAVYGLDAETFYEGDSGYSLRNQTMGTTEYVTDERFKLHCMSVRRHDQAKAKVLTEPQFRAWARTIDWKRTGMLAHHTQFDGLIASHHYDFKPAAMFCTMSMARPLVPIKVGVSLDGVGKWLGAEGKIGAEALAAVKGKRDLTRVELAALMKYAGNDIDLTWFIFHKLVDYLPMQELRIIDQTIRLYTDPRLLLEVDSLKRVRALDEANKLKLIRECGGDRTDLTSGEKFATRLRALGVEPPMKRSDKKSEKAGEDVFTLATSKQDQEFVDLASHENKAVRELIAARFAVMSNQMTSRCNRLIARAPLGAQPVYLKYWGAAPGRWSGGDLANWQNLSSKRKEGGAELRASVLAPPNHTLLIADLSQIEARLNAWESGQEDKLDVFRAYDKIIGWKTDPKTGELEPIRAGPDIYRYGASGTFNVPIEKVTAAQRFLGKMCELMLAYQAGAPRFARTLRLGAFGPPLDITDNLARDIHTAWRNTNAMQVRNWHNTQNNLRSAFFGQQRIEHGVVAYEGMPNGVGFIHGPGGMAMRYDGLRMDEEGMAYISEYMAYKNKLGARVEYTRLYGGIIVQNKMEFLGRRLIADMAMELCDYMPSAKWVLTTHDELVFAVPDRSAARMLKAANKIMSTPPSWAPNLPLAVDAHLSKRYDK